MTIIINGVELACDRDEFSPSRGVQQNWSPHRIRTNSGGKFENLATASKATLRLKRTRREFQVTFNGMSKVKANSRTNLFEESGLLSESASEVYPQTERC